MFVGIYFSLQRNINGGKQNHAKYILAWALRVNWNFQISSFSRWCFVAVRTLVLRIICLSLFWMSHLFYIFVLNTILTNKLSIMSGNSDGLRPVKVFRRFIAEDERYQTLYEHDTRFISILDTNTRFSILLSRDKNDVQVLKYLTVYLW